MIKNKKLPPTRFALASHWLRIGFARRRKDDEPTPIEQGILWETESSRFIQRLRSTETRDAFVTDSLKIVKRDEGNLVRGRATQKATPGEAHMLKVQREHQEHNEQRKHSL